MVFECRRQYLAKLDLLDLLRVVVTVHTVSVNTDKAPARIMAELRSGFRTSTV